MRKNLRAARKAMGYTQEQMAKMLGYKSKSHYCMIENGQRGISVEQALKIAGILHKPVEEIFNYPGINTSLTPANSRHGKANCYLPRH